jgi:hypothetical protein
MKKLTLPAIIFSAILLGSCTLVTKPNTPTPTPTPTASPTPTIDETGILKTVIKEALVKKHGQSANDLVITVSKIVGDYSQGGAAVPNMGGGMWFAAKVNGTWQLVWDGNGNILCDDLKDYPDFPVSLIPECYNQNTSKIVKR